MHTRRGTRTGRAVLILLALAWAACDGDAAGPVVVRSVVVTPSDTTLQAGETVQLQAMARDASGGAIPAQQIVWSGGSGSVAMVSPSGLVTAVGAGTVELTATIGGVQGTASVEVEGPEPGPQPGPVASVTLDRVELSLEEGTATTLIATAWDAQGVEVTGRVVQWTTSNVAVAPVGVFGEVTGVRVGSARITARVDGASTTADVTVTAEYGYDLSYDLSEGVGVAPVLFRLSISKADAEPIRILSGRQAMDAAVSPAGDRIAFRVYANGGSEIWVARVDGSDSLKVAGMPGWDVLSPSWSPDGQRIVYEAWSAQSPASEIWVVDADGTDAVSLTADQEGGSKQAPAWSPDRVGGDRIAYTRILDGRAHLWTMRPDGSDKTQITIGNVADMHPAWSPDGQRLAFERYGDSAVSGGDIWLVHASGASPTRLTNLPLAEFDPAWSPDGKLIAFSSGISSELQIYTIWTDGTKLARRTSAERPHERPVWIPK